MLIFLIDLLGFYVQPYLFFELSVLFFRFNLINLLVSSDIKKSISLTLLYGQDLSNVVLVMLAILLTVSSISAGVIASVSVKFLLIILLSFSQSVFRGVEFLFDFVSQFLTNLLPGEPACGRYLHLGLLYMYLPWSRYCD